MNREEYEQRHFDLVEEAKLKSICPECGEERPGDERVEAGMKCAVWRMDARCLKTTRKEVRKENGTEYMEGVNHLRYGEYPLEAILRNI